MLWGRGTVIYLSTEKQVHTTLLCSEPEPALANCQTIMSDLDIFA